MVPLNTGGQHQDYANGPQGQNSLPGLGSWHNTSSSSSGASNTAAGGPGQDAGGPSANGSNTGNNSASNSAHGTPQLQSRRPTIDASPRMPQSAVAATAAPSSARVRYDDGLASNAAVTKEEGASPPMARSGGGNGGQAQAQLTKVEAASPERDV